MGRSGSDLKCFLHDAVKKKRYHNLVCKDASLMIFQLIFPRKNEDLNTSYQMLLKDWDNLKGRIYRGLQDYSRAMRAFKRALKKSDYVVCLDEKQLIYRFASEEELKEIQKKRKRKKEEKKVLDVNMYSPDSGYDTAKSPEAALEYNHLNEKNSILSSIAHDHFFGGISTISEETWLLNVKKEELVIIPDKTSQHENVLISEKEHNAKSGNEIKAESSLPDDLVHLETMDTESLPPLNEKDYDFLRKELLSDPDFSHEFIASLESLLDPAGQRNLAQETCEVWQFVEMCDVTQDLLMFIFKPLEVEGIKNCEDGICFHMPGKEMEILRCSRIVKLHRLKDNYIMYLQLGGQINCI